MFKVPPTAKIVWGHGLKSHETDWRSRGSNMQFLVNKVSGLFTTPRQLLNEMLALITYTSSEGTD